MNHERIKGALLFRALMWHRATSFRAKPDYVKNSHLTVQDDKPVVIVHLDDAKKEADKATTVLRRSFFNLAVKAGQTLLDVLVEETIEQRPRPLDSFIYNGVLYKLQSIEGETCRYKKLIYHNEDHVTRHPITHRDRIQKELITMTELAFISTLTALTPSENEPETENA